MIAKTNFIFFHVGAGGLSDGEKRRKNSFFPIPIITKYVFSLPYTYIQKMINLLNADQKRVDLSWRPANKSADFYKLSRVK